MAVADERHFTRAAKRLGVAQPSVSSQIRRLEETLGVNLFERGGGPVALTEAGRELLPLARRVLSDVAAVRGRVADVESLRRGHVRIGATPSLAVALLPAALARFHRRHPGVSLTLSEQPSRFLLEGLHSNALDLALAVVPSGEPTLERLVLAVEELVVVTALDHGLAGRRRVTIGELGQVPLIMFPEGYDLRTTILDAFEEAGVEPTISLEGAGMGGVLPLVAAGLGAAIVPNIVAAAGPPLNILHLQAPRLQREIQLIRRRDREPSQAAAALASEITGLLSSRGWPSRVRGELRLLA